MQAKKLIRIMVVLNAYTLMTLSGYSENNPAKEILMNSMGKMVSVQNQSLSLRFNVDETSVNDATEVEWFRRDKHDLCILLTTKDYKRSISSNGEEAWLFDSRWEKQYVGLGIPESREKLVQKIADPPFGYLINWINYYISNETVLFSEVDTIWLMPDDQENAEYYQLKLSYKKYDIYLWITKDDEYIISRIKINLRKMYDKDIIIDTGILKWDNKRISADSIFRPNIPSKSIETTDEEKLSIGSEVPEFILPMIDGSEVNISKYLGNSVIMLCFWYTWCGPCRTTLPIVTTIVNEYNNVTLLLINEDKEYDVVKNYIEKNKVQGQIVLDRGSISDLFGVTSFPSTIFIDTDKKIKDILKGGGEGLEKKIRNNLDVILK